jgi:short-subunit dehydrogenase
MIDVNLWGVIYGSMAAYDVMTKQGHGHIVNMGSVSGLVSSPLTAAYTTAKFAVVGFSATLRAEAAAFGVKVNIVCPAFVQTNMHGTSTILNAPREDVLALNPVKKMSPAKAAQIILKGVSRNKKFIVFPFIGRLIWWSYRLNPSVGDLFARRTLKEFRSLRNAYHKQIL